MENDYLKIRAICHSVFAEEEKSRRKAQIKPINKDFLDDLPVQVRMIMDELCWTYKDQSWFEEAWEKYRKHVLDAGLGGKIKMPGFVFNEYIDRYVDEQEKKAKKELVHMETCDIEDLYHYGITGQKWGIRRYQNDDGTLTAEGKKRYGVSSDGKMSKEGASKYKQDRKEALKAAKKDLKENKLNVRWTDSWWTYRERLDAAKKYIEEKYGTRTMKDYYYQREMRNTIALGASFVATLGAVAYNAYNLGLLDH